LRESGFRPTETFLPYTGFELYQHYQKINIERSLSPFLKTRSKTGKCPPVFSRPPRVPVHDGVQSYILSLVFYWTCFTFFRGSAADSKRATRHRRADARRGRAPYPRSSGCAALAFISRPQRALLPSPTSPSPPPSRSRSPSLNTRPPRLSCPRAGRRCHHVHVPSKVEECRSRGGRAQAYLLRREPKSVRLEVARQAESERLEATRRIGLSAACYRTLSLVERRRYPPHSNNALDAFCSPTSTF